MTTKPTSKTIGLLAGMSWESSQVYYQKLNQMIKQKLGGLHSAPMVMLNVDFAPIEKLMSAGNWDELATILVQHCLTIEQAGADFLLVATNTMHKLAPQMEAALSIPLLHIADAVGRDLAEAGHAKVGLLGTAFTMQESFYRERLFQKFGIETLVPNAEGIKTVNQVIFAELCRGQINAESRNSYLEVIQQMVHQGAQAIILGCTEIGLLLQQSDTEVPLFDATASHIQAAVGQALSLHQ